MLHRVVEAIARPKKASDFVVSRAREALYWDRYYSALREPKSIGRIQNDDVSVQTIIDELRQGNVRVVETTIDLPQFREYLRVANYAAYWPYYDAGRAPKFLEKALEHYLAASLLNLGPGDVYIDIATDTSPVPAIYHRAFGCAVYRQDLAFPKGIHGDRIGGDAASLPVNDGFASKMALHCSFEHFEGDSDIRFIGETSRVLRHHGRVCIVPLYLNQMYAIQTNPTLLPVGGS